ncbi:MAG: peptidase M3 [Rhizobiales bacterium]|nr:peptidase M3 [Hyphomicrobiales bacterium]
MSSTDSSTANDPNPLLQPWAAPFAVPPFRELLPEHYRPAFDAALAEHRREIDAIASDPAAPGFDNTIAAMELAGQTLRRVSAVFFNLCGTDGNDATEAIEREIAPVLARHRMAILLNEALFRRVDDLHQHRDALGISTEQRRVLERHHIVFRRAGAGLNPVSKQRLAEITERLASLGTAFSQAVLADEKAFMLVLDGEADLAGLPDFLRAAARQAADERGHPGKHVITLGRSSIEPFLQFSARRDLREKAFKAWLARGENGGASDTTAIIGEMLRLRGERAKLLGFPSFAHFRLDDSMAKTPEAVLDLLNTVWEPARRVSLAERDALQVLIDAEGGGFALAQWDWRYYAEKLRKARYDLDAAEIKPYLQLDRIIDAAFETARRLFGLTFHPRENVALYHPDVRAWEVRDRDGRHIGLFLGDYFARPSKRSGAWMSGFRSQEKLAGDIRPIIVNVMNFAKGPPGEASLLSMDDARTLFHEFGHALHGLLSDVTYPSIAGTKVATDFVELPSQLYEHWLERPEILNRFAVHHRTGEPMPEALMRRVIASRNFNQGFATIEYVASALVDLDLHLLPSADNLDVKGFEQESLAKIGMPAEIAMRHRPPHFTHVFSGDGYAAGYYSYLWSEVLDADAFKAFEETGDVFDADTARRLRDFVYSAGYLRDPTDAYVAFRGRMPTSDALLKKRALAEGSAI